MVTLLMLLALTACDEPCPRGSMLESDHGLVVTEAEHPTGWGRTECSECHSHFVLHQDGCSEGVDLAEVREIVLKDGDASCMSCHGDNGTAELVPADTGVGE